MIERLSPIRWLGRWLIPLIILVIGGIGYAMLPLHSTAQSTTYPIVDTGQATCHDDLAPISCPAEGAAFYGQDAQFPGNRANYTSNQDGTITDNVTGLMWQQSPDTEGDGDIDAADKLTATEAVNYCDTLTFAGHSDWRLPDIKQLYSLIAFHGTDVSGVTEDTTAVFTPFIDTNFFAFAYGDTSAGERTIDAQYASSTASVSPVLGQEGTFGVNFADGRIKGYPLQKTFFVLCARGKSSYGQNSLQDNGDGTITDQATGLMWAQDDSGTGLNWQEALAWVATQNAASYGGYSDWRLPDAKELQSIVDYSRSPDATGSAAIDPRFNITSITNEAGATDYPAYWSSTTHLKWNGVSGHAAYVTFGRAMGYFNGSWMDVHGAGAQRSETKTGDPANWPTGNGPQGDAVRIYNYARLVRDADSVIPTEEPPTEDVPTDPTLSYLYLPLVAW